MLEAPENEECAGLLDLRLGSKVGSRNISDYHLIMVSRADLMRLVYFYSNDKDVVEP